MTDTDYEEPATTREHHLLDGRRVTVADLVESGLLPAGTPLTFTRLGTTYHGTATDTGRIRLADDREFAAPSRAAAEALGRGGGDGWYVWRVADSGRLLHDLRETLLDQAAETDRSAADSRMPMSPVRRRHDYLRRARNSAEAGEPVETTVGDLLTLWGAKGRGHRINQRIEADLDNHGLTTLPNFRKVTRDAVIALVAKRAEETGEAAPAPEPVSDEDEELEVGLTVGNLASALGGVESVAADASLTEAITKMLLNDYSQLAVLSGQRTVRGAVTWKSIARARHANASAGLAESTVQATEVRYDQDLIEILPTLADKEFVFVRDATNTPCGIVTTADVALAYGKLATPFLLIGEIDQLLRWLVARTFTIEDVVACCDGDGTRGVESFDDLAFGDYQRVLESPANWATLGWPLDRSALIARLGEIRAIRNDIMHFNPDPLPPGSEDMLRNFVKLLKGFIE
jgi:CBS domain-containing protein